MTDLLRLQQRLVEADAASEGFIDQIDALRDRAERAEARVRELENRERIPFKLKDGTVVEYQLAPPKGE